MTEERSESAAGLSFKMGEALLRNGAEIFRVQETMERVARAYDIEEYDVYVLSNAIFANAVENGEKIDTKLKFVPGSTVHFGRIVGINTARFDSSAEVRTALIHEDGHFASGAFYLPYSPYQLKAQAEYRADKAAVLKHIPYPELAARLRRGDTLADAAEYFCVTEDFLCKAYALYRDMGYSFGAEEKT